MKQVLPILFLFAACSSHSDKTENKTIDTVRSPMKMTRKKDMSDPTNTLTTKTETFELEYIVWGCACANWVTPADFKKYQDNKLAEHCIFLEPANPELKEPLYFDPARHMVKVTGQFYVKPDYPKGTEETEEQLGK